MADKYEDAAKQVGRLTELFDEALTSFGSSREISIAKTKLDEVELWTLKHLSCLARAEEQAKNT
jgi:hypothetical protein